MANWTQAEVDALAAAITDRRTYIGRSQLEVWRHGGPSNSTMTSLEASASRSITNATLRKLDIGLDWLPGTAARTLAGELKPSTAARDPRFDTRQINEIGDQPPEQAKHRRVDTAYLGRLLEAKAKPLEERTPEDDQLVRESMEWRRRAAASADRAVREEPLVDLVDAGQQLASRRPSDNAVVAYVRKVESYVVSEMGIERLTSALDARLSERLIVRANQNGVLDEFMAEIDRLRVSGIAGNELLRRLSAWLDHKLKPDDPDQAALLKDMHDGLREMADQVEAARDDFGLAARTAAPGYRKGQSEQREADEERNQESDHDA